MGKADIGPPNFQEMLPEVIKKNYGNWKYHEILKPGVMRHVAESGDELYTVRAGSPRLVSVDFIRDLCDIADQYCDGHLRFTSRYNIEFLTPNKKNVKPIIEAGKKIGLPVGGPAHCSDLAIVGVHRKPPKVNQEKLAAVCEIPTVMASCPTGAIRRHPDKDLKAVVVKEDLCMYCGNCFTVCPAMPLADGQGDGIAIYAGGKVSNARKPPMFSRLVVPYLPNNPPRWPEVVDIIKKIVEVYAKNAHKYERMGEGIERIGWERFFPPTGVPFR